VGYIAVVYISVSYAIRSLLRGCNSLLGRVISASIICMFPFIFQRLTIWESGLFSLLFAPFLIQEINQEC